MSAEQSSWRRVRRHSSDYRLSTGTEQAAHPHALRQTYQTGVTVMRAESSWSVWALHKTLEATEEELWGLRKTLSPQYNSGEWRTRQTQMWKAQQTSWATKTTEEGAVHSTKCNLASLASYCCDRDQSPKQTDENERILAHSSQSVMESGQELSVGTGPEARKEHCFPRLAQTVSDAGQDQTVQEQSPTVLGPPIDHWSRKYSQTCLQANWREVLPWLNFPLPGLTSVCVKSTKI